MQLYALSQCSGTIEGALLESFTTNVMLLVVGGMGWEKKGCDKGGATSMKGGNYEALNFYTACTGYMNVCCTSVSTCL